MKLIYVIRPPFSIRTTQIIRAKQQGDCGLDFLKIVVQLWNIRWRHASMPNIVTALIISMISIIGICIAAGTLSHLRRKRALKRMVSLNCPTCSRIYSSSILSTMRQTSYFWNPAPGHSVISLRLPGSTFLVVCPHCSMESEFTTDGIIFERPKTGVRSFTRTVIVWKRNAKHRVEPLS